MTPERTAGLVARWVRFYTRNLPPAIARRRIDEIDADLHDHIAHERAYRSAVRVALAGVLIGGTGLLYELAVRKPGNVAYRAAAIAVGVAAIVLGEADDAPGLVLFGGLLILGTAALAVRTAQRSE